MFQTTLKIATVFSLLIFAFAASQSCAQDTQLQDIKVQQVNSEFQLMFDGVSIAKTSQQVTDPKLIKIQDSNIKIASWGEIAAENVQEQSNFFSVQTAPNKWSTPRRANYKVMLKSGSFVPQPGVARVFAADGLQLKSEKDEAQLYYVQFVTPVLPEYRNAIKKMGGEVLGFIPNYCLTVRMPQQVATKVNDLDFVRYSELFHPRYKIGKALVAKEARNYAGAKRFTIYSASDNDREKLVGQIKELGGKSFPSSVGKRLLSAELDADKFMDLLKLSTVQWVEPFQEIEDDMDNARIQGGANFVESATGIPDGYTGVGIRGHVMEGVEASHPDFAANGHRAAPIAVDDGASSSHGHATFGIVFGSGANDPQAAARGMLPNAQGHYTHYRALTAPTGGTGSGSRYDLTGRLMNDHQVMFQTASWGNGRTTDYTAHSAEMDRIIFDHDIPITQSQSNAGDRMSRPQAWAKNIISVGGVVHGDNSNPGDDSWLAGNASIGPAEDGRKKPDICAYYDATRTTGLSDSYRNFGGTSGATPIVAGHLGLLLEMWTRGDLGNTLSSPTGNPFENRPHFTTAKALLIASATQYSFDATSTDNKREHQGWGFPDLKRMYENRDKLFIVNEDDQLSLFDTKSYDVHVGPGESVLKICMTFADPPGEPNAAIARVNDLTLRVTAPDGSKYWGNAGLDQGNFSTTGGSPDEVDTVESVFVQNPTAGKWVIDVIANEISVDAHLETADVDADFALVAMGVTNSQPPRLVLKGCCAEFHLLGQTGTAAYCYKGINELVALEFDGEDDTHWFYRESARPERRWAVPRCCDCYHRIPIKISDPTCPDWQFYACMTCTFPGTCCCCR